MVHCVTYFIRESITVVQLASSLTGLEATKQKVYVLLVSRKAIETKTVKLKTSCTTVVHLATEGVL